MGTGYHTPFFGTSLKIVKRTVWSPNTEKSEGKGPQLPGMYKLKFKEACAACSSGDLFTHPTFEGNPVCERQGNKMNRALSLWTVIPGSLLSPTLRGQRGGAEIPEPTVVPKASPWHRAPKGGEITSEGLETEVSFSSSEVLLPVPIYFPTLQSDFH